MDRLRIALAQLDGIAGDLAGNIHRMIDALDRARGHGADLVVFPELAIPGAPPNDLLLRPAFLERNREAMVELAGHTRGLTAVVGFAAGDGGLYNAAAVLSDGALAGICRQGECALRKAEGCRYFDPGDDASLYPVARFRVGITIGADLAGPVAERLARSGADLILNLDAAPYVRGQPQHRKRDLARRAAALGAPIAYVNRVGGQDERVFDGGSAIVAPSGAVLAEGALFREDLVIFDLVRGALPPALPPAPHDDLAEVYEALTTGLRDYVQKNGFGHVALGLSGGIDSALVATIAVDALGADAVTAVWLPSRYSSEISRVDAAELANALGIDLLTLPIERPYEVLLETLEPFFQGRAADLTEENLQARVRGVLLMALSNKFGWLVLTTSNKSEAAVGYSTLYGDMAGGLAVLKDVSKTLVFDLARWRNARSPVIPERTITRPPSAELRPDQRDTDSLPPYEVLDPILERYVEQGASAEELIGEGFDVEIVRRVTRLVDRSEYKRRQAPPGIKITARAFGTDDQMPMTVR
jgi:NAD+ synthase (glutamine-hydrolysing)